MYTKIDGLTKGAMVIDNVNIQELDDLTKGAMAIYNVDIQELDDVYQDVSAVVMDSLTEGAKTIAEKVSFFLFLFSYRFLLYSILHKSTTMGF